MAGSPWAFLPFIEHLLGNETKRNLPVRSEVVQKRESLRLRNSTLVTFLSVKIKLVTAISCKTWTIVFPPKQGISRFLCNFPCKVAVSHLKENEGNLSSILYRLKLFCEELLQRQSTLLFV